MIESQVPDNTSNSSSNKIHRIDRKYIYNELLSIFNLEKGGLFTIKELLIRPGISIREYITENRSKHVKPITYIVLTSVIYSLVASLVDFKAINTEKAVKYQSSYFTYLLNLVETHYDYANIMMGILIAIFLKIFFRKYHYNFYEIIVLLCFVMGQGMLYFALMLPFHYLVNGNLFQLIFSLTGLIYPAWAIGQFFDKKKFLSYFKATIAYFLGFISFYVIVAILGIMLDLIFKS